MFRTLLIANRGEIACRIVRTARAMGIRTVTVHSEADVEALHARSADASMPIGPAAANESYLCIPRLIDAARRAGAEAVHPGYGFLSENAEFAEACAEAGLVFVGPPASAIRAMGRKDAAKRLMEEAGVPVVPGHHGDVQEPGALLAAAQRIGFPVLIKAVSGGGGKGMRTVQTEAEFAEALGAARREASTAFGDDRVLVEKLLERPRHIEVQVFADAGGNAVHLFERDCSLQRRHQKIVEEAPAPGIDAGLRARMGEAAVRAARAIGYVGAGTVEFITTADVSREDTPFYFMEMNTRLQVEHPVTEAICGVDLVRWQLEVAAGRPLSRTQSELRIDGHAIEVRLYAEEPERDFLPQTGRLIRFRGPAEAKGLRLDSGVAEGDEVSHHYDPMLAKLIAHGADRDEALSRLRTALLELEVAGVRNNLSLLTRIVSHPAFVAGEVDTGFIARHAVVPRDPPRVGTGPDHRFAPWQVALLVAAELERRAEVAAEAQRTSGQPGVPRSPWAATDAFRCCGPALDELHWVGDVLPAGELDVRVLFEAARTLLEFELGDQEIRAVVEGASIRDGRIRARVDGALCSAGFVVCGAERHLLSRGEVLTLALEVRGVAGEAAGDGDGAVRSPMPGKVVALLTREGEAVERGAPLLRLEAMKMEHTLRAPRDGVVSGLSIGEGDQVDEGEVLLVVSAEA